MKAKPTFSKTGSGKRKAESTASSGVKWWMKLAMAIISPLACLVLIELVLWIVGYGVPKRFFVPWKVSGKTLYLSNKQYCEHFVAKALSRAPDYVVLGAKSPGTIRIFVLGSSAAYGDPDPAYGFCRQLDVLLNASVDPCSVRFEVVNAAVTAMNSHVAVRIARDAARLQPDLFIIYMGNNEVIGPYGPTSLPPALYSSRAFINAAILVKKETRLGQLLKNVGESLRSRGRSTQMWQGMEAFLANHIREDDPRMETCYRHFASNIRDIVQTAQNSGARTILCTVPTNIESCRPFGSDHAPTLTKEQLDQWQQCFERGQNLAKSGDCEAALSQYELALAIDGKVANLAFRMGQCLAALGRADEAKRKFVEARDLDTLRFRADSRINTVVRKAGKTLSGEGVTLLDLESRLEEKSKSHLLGDEMLVDHVHLSFRGNCLAATAAVEMIARVLPQARLNPITQTDEQLLDLCRQRLVFDDLEAYRLATVMHRRKTVPPFANQMDHNSDLERVEQEVVALRRATKRTDTPETAYVESLRHRLLDPPLSIRYAEWLVKKGRTAESVALLQKLLDAWPFDMRVRVAMAQTLVRSGRKDLAIAMLTSRESPDHYDHVDTLLLLGAYCGGIGATSQAADIYDELHRVSPRNVDGLVNRAAAAFAVNDLTTMKQCLDRALKVNPDSAQAVMNMGNYYARMGRTADAQRCFARGVQIDPYNYLGHIGLGVQSVLAGEQAKGIEHVAMAVALKPDFFEGRRILAALLTETGRAGEAKEQAELAALFQP
jgi:tetratricopeptide (TPR) repeat protein